jgi:hypothetical protein
MQSHQEGEVGLRNQLFVALSRSRGWVQLSGTATPAAFCHEVRSVLAAGETVTFTMSQPRRNLNDADSSESVGAEVPAAAPIPA